MQRKYNSRNITKNLKTIVTEFTDDKLDLDAEYQRDVVWTISKMKAFINSCYRGIIPIPILISSSEDKDICVDGKQRITSLIKYYNNEYSFKKNEDDDEIEYYYSEVPDDFSDEYYKVLDKKDKKRLDKLSMNIIEYDDLSYFDQVQIFYRIQQGCALKAGEKIIAMITDYKLANLYNKQCSKYIDLLTTFYKIDRKDHILFLTNIFTIMENKRLIKPNESQRKKFIEKLTDKDKINNIFEKYDKLLKIVFSDKLLLSEKITTKITDNLKFSFIYYIKTNYKKDNYDFDTKQMREALISTINYSIDNENIGSKTNEKILNLLFENYRKIYKELNKTKLLSIDSDQESIKSDQEYENYETDYDSDCDEISIISNKSNKSIKII
tara:strand:+ start:576 stop:1721 length:1146 start_codon:yes stop_codon:yes gene_type:complete